MSENSKNSVKLSFYKRQLTVGCYNKKCNNPLCANNPSFSHLSEEEVSKKALSLVWILMYDYIFMFLFLSTIAKLFY